MSPSIWQILIVVAVFAILFMGPSRIPGIGKSLGEAIRGFKKGLDDTEKEIDVTDSVKREQVAEGEEKAGETQKETQKETT